MIRSRMLIAAMCGLVSVAGYSSAAQTIVTDLSRAAETPILIPCAGRELFAKRKKTFKRNTRLQMRRRK